MATVSNRCVIVGSGPSAKGFIPPPGLKVIAVNGAIQWLPRADYFFTLDHSRVNMLRLLKRRPGVEYHAAFPRSQWLKMQGIRFYDRVAEDASKSEPRIKHSPEWWLWRWGAKLGLSESKAVIHTGNSAYGALGLAYHLGFTSAALIGVDGTRDRRIEGGHPMNLDHLPLLFASARPQIKVVSCGQLDGIPRMKFADWYRNTNS